MYHIPKESDYARCSAFELLNKSSSYPQGKMFRDVYLRQT